MPFPLALAILSIAGTPITGGVGATERLQSAIDACPSTGCVIELPDALYPMTNVLWIEGKSDLRIVGTGATKPVLIWDEPLLVADSARRATLFQLTPPTGAGRPRLPKGWLMWPYAYKSGVGTASDSSISFSTTGYQHAAMILVKNSKRIHLENLVVDGRKPAAFQNLDVWDGLHDLNFGSIGISLIRSLAVDIRACEIRNFWTGFYISNRNPSCQAWKNMIGRSDTGANPWSACGTMGGHLIERNRIHTNWWAVYSQTEWDQGSTIRENLAWNNANQVVRNPTNTVSPLTAMLYRSEDYGGFLYSKDALMPAHVVTHNTIHGNALAYGYDMYRISGTALWSNNVVHAMDSLGGRQLFGTSNDGLDDYVGSGNHVWHNTILSHMPGEGIILKATSISDSTIQYPGRIAIPRDTVVELVGGKLVERIVYDTVPGTLHCGTGCYVKLSPPDTTVFFESPWSLNAFSDSRRQVQIMGPDSILRTIWVSNLYQGWNSILTSDSAALVGYLGQDSISVNARANWVCHFCDFVSLDPNSPGFLVLDSTVERHRTRALGVGPVAGHRGAIGPSGALGSHVPVRLRARGLPVFDASRSLLHLPVSITSEAGRLDAMAVAKIQVFDRSVDSLGVIFARESKVAIQPSDVQTILPTDTVISIPWKNNSSAYYQIDLWAVGISGGDTLAATPVSWVWTPKAKGGAFQLTTGVDARRAPPTVRVLAGSGLLRLQGYTETSLRLTDATGATKTLATRFDQDGRSISTRGLRPGIWFAHLPGGTQRVFVSP